MKNLSIIILILFSTVAFSQTINISENELRVKLDSVLLEGNLLFKYEKVAWVSTDIIHENISLSQQIGGYFTYEDGNNIKVIFIDKKYENCIAEYIFKNNFNKPEIENIINRKLSEKENNLLQIRDKMLEHISNGEYEIHIPDGFNPNLIFLPFDDKYKLYIIMGTSQNDIIPFGNDYYFIADKNGKIENWQKFHSRIIPSHTEFQGNKVSELTHSHLKSTPLITATDICTFMLYAPLYGLNTFSVYSPAIGKYMTYNIDKNDITIKE